MPLENSFQLNIDSLQNRRAPCRIEGNMTFWSLLSHCRWGKTALRPNSASKSDFLSFSLQSIFFRLLRFYDFPKLGVECRAYARFLYFSPFLISQAPNSWRFEPFYSSQIIKLILWIICMRKSFSLIIHFFMRFSISILLENLWDLLVYVQMPLGFVAMSRCISKPRKQLHKKWNGLSLSLRTSSHPEYWDKRELRFCHNIIF